MLSGVGARRDSRARAALISIAHKHISRRLDWGSSATSAGNSRNPPPSGRPRPFDFHTAIYFFPRIATIFWKSRCRMDIAALSPRGQVPFKGWSRLGWAQALFPEPGKSLFQSMNTLGANKGPSPIISRPPLPFARVFPLTFHPRETLHAFIKPGPRQRAFLNTLREPGRSSSSLFPRRLDVPPLAVSSLVAVLLQGRRN